MRKPKHLPFVWSGRFAGEPPPRPSYRTPLGEVILCSENVLRRVEDLREDGMAKPLQGGLLWQIWCSLDAVRNVARRDRKVHWSLKSRLEIALRALSEIPKAGPLFDYQRDALADIETELRRGFAADLHLVQTGETRNETLPDIFF